MPARTWVNPTLLEVQRLAEEGSTGAIRRLIQLSHESPNAQIALAASVAVLDRAFGKPKQSVELQRVTEDESNARAFAAAVIRLHPELAEAAFSGKPLPELIDVTPALPSGEPDVHAEVPDRSRLPYASPAPVVDAGSPASLDAPSPRLHVVTSPPLPTLPAPDPFKRRSKRTLKG